MTIPEDLIDSRVPEARVPTCIGLVVHPTRSLEEPLSTVRDWADRNGVDLIQIRGFDHQQQVADKGNPMTCDLIVSVGGDGTTLAALHAGVDARRPVLGIACGSLGVLTTVAVDGIATALDRFSAGDWIPKSLPALDVKREAGAPLVALNDLVVIRAGEGQVRVGAKVDGALFARMSGDGCVVSTPVGSSAYTLSAGGPLIVPGTEAFVFTPLAPHGGFCPPFVVASGSELTLRHCRRIRRRPARARRAGGRLAPGQDDDHAPVRCRHRGEVRRPGAADRGTAKAQDHRRQSPDHRRRPQGGPSLRLILNIIWLVLRACGWRSRYTARGAHLLHPDHHDPVRHRGVADRRVRAVAVRQDGDHGATTPGSRRASATSSGSSCVGWWLALGHLVTGVALCLTIIGIPLGLANFKLIPISLLPLGREIVSTDELATFGVH